MRKSREKPGVPTSPLARPIQNYGQKPPSSSLPLTLLHLLPVENGSDPASQSQILLSKKPSIFGVPHGRFTTCVMGGAVLEA
jgi:hypothetical protein